MGVTNQQSTQVTNAAASPVVKAAPYDNGKVRIVYFSHTQVGAGDATSTVDLVKLPAGKIRVLKRESGFVCSAFGASRTLDIGYTAHTKSDGATAVAAAADVITDGADVSALAFVQCGAGTNALTADPTLLLDSKDGVMIQAVVAGGTIPDGATLKGYIAYVTAN